MEKGELRNLITIIKKASDKNAIFKALIRIRTDLVKDKAGIQQFYDTGGIPPIVRLLSKPYEKILEVALSILGNCCTRKDCCKQAISNGVVPPLLTILKSIPNPRVQCRACRLLGNLARESNEKICTLAKGIGVVLASVLEDSKDVPTLCMTVRAIRLLWTEMQFYEEFVRFDGVDKILGILVKSTMVERKPDAAKSIVEQNSYEKGRVQFMATHIQIMESVNSKVFDHEILKTTKPPVEDAFKIPEVQDLQELFLEILRCLETVTNIPALRIVYNFYQNRYSTCCITFFANKDSPFRAQSLKILSNLVKSNGKNALNEADAVTTACALITATDLLKPLTEAEERHCICIICFLADDACNRAKIRKSGAFKRLLELAKNTTSDSLLTMILIGLQHFRYDNMSIDLMIRMGLVNVLIKLLDLKTKDLSETHESTVLKKIDSKRSFLKDSDDDADAIVSPKKMKIDCCSTKFIPRDLDSPPVSMGSASFALSSPSSSPCRSMSSSPRSLSPVNDRKSMFYDDIDDYSPVVSDIEDQNENDNISDGNEVKGGKKDEVDKYNVLQQILNECSRSKCDSDEENLLDSDQREENDEAKEREPTLIDNSEKKKTIQLIICILCSASYRLKHAPFELSLCTNEILSTLIQTCRVAFRRRANDTPWDSQGAPLVLSHICSETKNFAPLLKQDFIFKVNEMANPVEEHENCQTCVDLKLVSQGLLNLLSDMAETGYAKGEMEHVFLKDDKEMCKRVSIIAAMIIRDPKTLNFLLFKHGVLFTIIDIILTKDETLSVAAASGLTALSKRLKIKIPKYNPICISKSEVELCNWSSDNVDDDKQDDFVYFVADQKLSYTSMDEIRYSKTLLTENSEVFNRMFNSDFKESKDRKVIMKNHSIIGIKYFLDCFSQHVDKKAVRIPVDSETNKVSVLPGQLDDNSSDRPNIIMAVLEAYDICQVYMLSELEINIYNMIIFLLSAENVLDVFEFSMRNHKPELTEMSVNYFLTASIASDIKVQILRRADNLEYYKEWNEILCDTIACTCQNLIL